MAGAWNALHGYGRDPRALKQEHVIVVYKQLMAEKVASLDDK